MQVCWRLEMALYYFLSALLLEHRLKHYYKASSDFSLRYSALFYFTWFSLIFSSIIFNYNTRPQCRLRLD